MLQQINLFDHLEIQRKFTFSLETMVWLFAGFWLLLCINLGNVWWQKHQLANQLLATNADYLKAQQQILAITNKYPYLDPNDLNKSIADLQANLDANERVITALEPNAVFSSYLQALSAAVVPGVWLNEIIFSINGERITLKGDALQASNIQQLLQQLISQSAFAGISFELQGMDKIAVKTGTLASFVIISHEKELI